jgi:SAM-dependent methyltransferase
MPTIDWNAVWRQIQSEKQSPARDPEFWDKRAPSFAKHAAASDYIDEFMAIMKPQPDWSVLDVGCAAGTLAVPLATSVKRITAMDPSAVMRALLKERCDQAGIDNIAIVDGRWEDDWDELGIGMHDVAVASRSLMVEDLQKAILKLQRHTRRRIYIATLVGDGPRDRKIIEAVGRTFQPGPDYSIAFNLLRQMDIFANVTFICGQNENSYEDAADALDSMRWMVQDITAAEEKKLEDYLRRTLVQENGRWRLPYRRVVRWAVLWWDKDCASDRPQDIGPPAGQNSTPRPRKDGR